MEDVSILYLVGVHCHSDLLALQTTKASRHDDTINGNGNLNAFLKQSRSVVS